MVLFFCSKAQLTKPTKTYRSSSLHPMMVSMHYSSNLSKHWSVQAAVICFGASLLLLFTFEHTNPWAVVNCGSVPHNLIQHKSRDDAYRDGDSVTLQLIMLLPINQEYTSSNLICFRQLANTEL